MKKKITLLILLTILTCAMRAVNLKIIKIVIRNSDLNYMHIRIKFNKLKRNIQNNRMQKLVKFHRQRNYAY